MDKSTLFGTLNTYYDRKMFHPEIVAVFGEGDFNLGYWTDETRTLAEANEELFERIVRMIPEKRGRILDAGCGRGGTVRRLLRYYPPEAVTGINISDKQLAFCRKLVPGCSFLHMDAADMSFEDTSFDAIISVESAFHFFTREQFLGEALRVLKPGGRLAMSDSLLAQIAWSNPAITAVRRGDRPTGREPRVVPPENAGLDMDEYVALFHKVGFVEVQITDVTQYATDRYFEEASKFAEEAYESGRVTENAYREIRMMSLADAWLQRPYVLVSALRP